MKTLYDGDTFTVQGLTFKFTSEYCDGMQAPWVENDGHGEVRETSTGYYDRVSKKPGERVLHNGGSRGTTYLYDWAGAMQTAKRDGWGLSEAKRPANWETLTLGKRTELAVQSDFDYLQGWANDDWTYIGVIVTLMVEDSDGDLVEYEGGLSGDFHDSLWGVEDKGDYHVQVAHELAEGIAEAYLKEQSEATYWASRDVLTTA